MTNQTSQIAVFLDIENFINMCYQLNQPIDLSPILTKLIEEEGQITLCRSYGDITKSMQATGRGSQTDTVRRMLRDNLFQHTDLPYGGGFKNSADIHLVVEAMETSYALPHINKFAVVSGDSDYAPLFQKLKEQSKSIIGVSGSESRTGSAYSRACDVVFYYEDLCRSQIHEEIAAQSQLPKIVSAVKPIEATGVIKVTALGNGNGNGNRTGNGIPAAPALPPAVQIKDSELPGATATEAAAAQTEEMSAAAVSSTASVVSEPSVFDYLTVRDDYVNLMVKAVNLLRQEGKQATIPTLSSRMRQLQSDFDCQRANFGSFGDLVGYAEQQKRLIAKKYDKDLYIYLPDAAALSRQETTTADYRQFMKDRMKVDLLVHSERLIICDVASALIANISNPRGIYIGELSYEITECLDKRKIYIDQDQIFKYLVSLTMAGCFQYQTDGGVVNADITGFRLPKDQWDEQFVSSQVKAMSFDKKLSFYPVKLSKVFYEDEGQSLRIQQLLSKMNVKSSVPASK